MFTTQRINLFDFFHPIGRTPAVSLTQSLPLEVSANILLLGCGDLRDTLFTAHLDDRLLDITSCDVQKAVIARNILLLTLIIDDVDAKNDASIWDIYYHMRIDKNSDDLLKAQALKLAELSTTIDTWNQSKYGPQLKFCDIATLADVRTMWLFYSSTRAEAGDSTANKCLDSAIDAARSMMLLPEDGVVLTGFRSAGPAQLGAFSDMDTLHKRFWTFGTLDPPTGSSERAMLPNRMFLMDDGTSTLHYGIDPLLGFHLATAYAPLEPHSPSEISGTNLNQLARVIEAARLEFRQWTASFRRRAGSITLRFFAGDAIAFAYTLQNARASGSAMAGLYRDRYTFEPLTLIESEYSAADAAPLTFDVVDTSNLCDVVGGLNLLTAVSPLLSKNLASTVYTQSIPKSANSHKEMMNTMLCGDTPTVSTLLGLFPAEFWTNASTSAYGDEGFLDILEVKSPHSQHSGKPYRTQLSLRVAWKRPPCLDSSGETSDVRLLPIQFAEEDLAHNLYQIYVRMFDDEDMAKDMLDTLSILKSGYSAVSQNLNPQPQYHRASLVAFLRLVQRRVSCDWDRTMRLFIDLIGQRPNAPMGTVYFQELFAHLHVLNVHTVDIYRSPSLVSGADPVPAGSNHLRSWKNIGPVVCVTLKVPRQYIKAFTDENRLSFGSPAVHCRLSDGDWANLFPACQFSFGELSTRGIRHSDGFEVCINEDKAGWNGTSALIVSFYTPSWAILQDYLSTTVCFGLHSTSLMIKQFTKHYGPGLDIYETAITNTDSVYITKYAPNQRAFPTVQGFSPDQVTPADETDGISTQKLTANGDPQTGSLQNVVGRLDINSEKLRAALKEGAPVAVANPSPCHSIVTLGEEQPLDLFFPIPVLSTDQKVRIARKSSYVEVVAQVATVSSSADFPTSFIYPLYLTGNKKTPLAWTMSHLNLQKQPALNLPGPYLPLEVKGMVWWNAHCAMQISRRERALLDDGRLPRSSGEKVRLRFKRNLQSILVGFSGIRTPSRNLAAISCLRKGGIRIFIFVNKLRIDLATRTIVMDCAVLPVTTNPPPELTEFIFSIPPRVECLYQVDEAELCMWEQVLSACVERCRTDWSHGDDCEYRTAGKIPLPEHRDTTGFLCTCGQGVFPCDFTLPGVPGWQSMAKQYSTRAAISPMYWAPFADQVYVPNEEELAAWEKLGSCNVCGAKGKDLTKCGRCQKVEYCSFYCQEKDWEAHKTVCSTTY